MHLVALVSSVNAIPVTNVGWTWGATMGAIQNFLIGGGIVTIGGLILRATIALKRIAIERQKADAERDSERWGELVAFNDILQKRVDKLENDLREERRRCEGEMKALHTRIESLQAALFQNAASLGNILQLPPNAPTTAAKLAEKGNK